MAIVAFDDNITVMLFHIKYYEKRWKSSDTRNAIIYTSEFPAPPLTYMTKHTAEKVEVVELSFIFFFKFSNACQMFSRFSM